MSKCVLICKHRSYFFSIKFLFLLTLVSADTTKHTKKKKDFWMPLYNKITTLISNEWLSQENNFVCCKGASAFGTRGSCCFLEINLSHAAEVQTYGDFIGLQSFYVNWQSKRQDRDKRSIRQNVTEHDMVQNAVYSQ